MALTSPTLLRVAELSLRAEGDGRTVYGRVVPYNVEATVNDGRGPYREMFAPGAFSRSIEQRSHKVRLMVNHETRQLPIGRAEALTEQDDGLYGSFRVSETRAGEEALTLVRDGVVDSFSVGFHGIQHRNVSGVTVRTEAALREVSLVGFPAYEGALVGGVRAIDGLTAEQFSEYLASLDPEARTAFEQAVTLTGDTQAPQEARHGDSPSDNQHGTRDRGVFAAINRQLLLKEQFNA